MSAWKRALLSSRAVHRYPMLCALLLRKAWPSIRERKPSELSRSIRFLYREYGIVWWELLDIFRRLYLMVS